VKTRNTTPMSRAKRTPERKTKKKKSKDLRITMLPKIKVKTHQNMMLLK
jgi:hypothetical protein